MASGTPYEGRDNLIVPKLYQALTSASELQMGLYTNAIGSLTATSVNADITSPAGTGYAIKTLSGIWSSTNGVVTYDDGSPDNVIWTNSGGSTWTGGDVTGAYLRGGSGTLYLLHFRDFTAGITMDPGIEIEIDLSTLVG